MGQAKARKQEIAALKSAAGKMVKVIAKKHLVNGLMEITAFMIELKKPVNDKNILLQNITGKEWGHNPPADLIGDYLVQTKTYAMVKMMKPFEFPAFTLNFYEKGADLDNKFAASCRGIECFDEAKWDAHLEAAIAQAKALNIDIQRHYEFDGR